MKDEEKEKKLNHSLHALREPGASGQTLSAYRVSPWLVDRRRVKAKLGQSENKNFSWVEEEAVGIRRGGVEMLVRYAC